MNWQWTQIEAMIWLRDKRAAVSFGKRAAFVPFHGFQKIFRPSEGLALISCIHPVSCFGIEALCWIWANKQGKGREISCHEGKGRGIIQGELKAAQILQNQWWESPERGKRRAKVKVPPADASCRQGRASLADPGSGAVTQSSEK